MSNFPTKPTLSDVQHWSFRPSTYKTFLAGSGQVKATDGFLTGIFVSSGTPTILVYDTTGTTGTTLIPAFVSAVAGNYQFPDVKFDNGCYLSLTNAGTVTVFYK
jgi:hypothetical protein